MLRPTLCALILASLSVASALPALAQQVPGQAAPRTPAETELCSAIPEPSSPGNVQASSSPDRTVCSKQFPIEGGLTATVFKLGSPDVARRDFLNSSQVQELKKNAASSQSVSSYGDGAGSGYEFTVQAIGASSSDFYIFYVYRNYGVLVYGNGKATNQLRQFGLQIDKNLKSLGGSTVPTPVPTKPSAPPATLKVNIGCATSKTDPGLISCTAQTSDKRADAQIEYEWRLDGQPPAGQKGGQAEFKGLPRGSHTVSVVSVDTKNSLRSAPDSVTMDVEGVAPAGPTTGTVIAPFSNPSPAATTVKPAGFGLTVSCRLNSSGDIECKATPGALPDAALEYSWTVNGGAGQSNTASLTVPGASVGAYIIMVSVKDGKSGQTATASDTVMVGNVVDGVLKIFGPMLTGTPNPDPVDVAKAAAGSAVGAAGIAIFTALQGAASAAAGTAGGVAGVDPAGGSSPAGNSPNGSGGSGGKPATLPEGRPASRRSEGGDGGSAGEPASESGSRPKPLTGRAKPVAGPESIAGQEPRGNGSIGGPGDSSGSAGKGAGGARQIAAGPAPGGGKTPNNGAKPSGGSSLPPAGPSPEEIEAKRQALKKLQEESSAANASASRWTWATRIAEGIKKAADLSVDVLEKFTGPAGKAVKTTYTFAKNIGEQVGTAHAEGGSYTKAVLKGVVAGGADVTFAQFSDGMGKIVGGKIPPFYKLGPTGLNAQVGKGMFEDGATTSVKTLFGKAVLDNVSVVSSASVSKVVSLVANNPQTRAMIWDQAKGAAMSVVQSEGRKYFVRDPAKQQYIMPAFEAGTDAVSGMAQRVKSRLGSS